jgi:HK97 family phage portal protein
VTWLDSLRRLFTGQPAVSYRWFGDPAFRSAEEYLANALDPSALSAEQMWRKQPNLRTVVNFAARNVAQLGLHTFERVDETDRRRNRTSTAARLIGRPNPYATTYELVFGTVADLALYDICYWATSRSSSSPSGWEVHRIPVPWVSSSKGDLFGYGEFKVQSPDAQDPVVIAAEDMLVFHGWAPGSLRDGASPMEALKDILTEQLEAMRYRMAVWKRGGKVSSVITRPAGVRWSNEQRDAFRADWRSKFTGASGSQVGGTPILEDGMTLNKVDFSAREQEFVEGAKLSLATVASVYHINPTMVGLLDNANYSNVREFRKMLYGDSLGPTIAMIEDRLNAFLLPRLGDPEDLYVEFNIAEKLQGNFEEQAAVLQGAVGAPYMTRTRAAPA